jgi:type IV pilus assembly protein PilC
MLFEYKVIDKDGSEKEGTIDAANVDVAISSLQRRGFTISSVNPSGETSLLKKNISFFDRVSSKEMVVLSRQISTLFEAQVSALKVFRLLASESENILLSKSLSEISDDLQAGSSISNALGKHPKIFSNFYVNMVKAGEESGKLDQIFSYLADYLDRNDEVSSKAKNALIYPAFVIATFVTVMIMMLTLVIPKLSAILIEAGQEIPIYTKVVLIASDLLVSYGIFLLLLLVVGGFFTGRFMRTENGKKYFSKVKLNIPFLGNLYRKLYLSRIADNMNTMLLSGISMVKAIEITASVVDDRTYSEIMTRAVEAVKGGSPLSEALSEEEEIPNILLQMIRVGEETGKLGDILETLSKFYRREVSGAVDTLVDLIEPAMIVLLGLGVGFVLASVLVPIYNISSAI